MKKKWFLPGLFVTACFCIVFSACYVAYFSTNGKTPLKSEYHLFLDKEGWSLLLPDDSISSVVPGETVENEAGTVAIAKEIFPEEMGENVLLFRNNRQCVKVQADGETIFQLGSGKRHFKLSATGYCAAPLPEKGHAYLLKITFLNLENGVCHIPEIRFGSLNDILIFLCAKDIVTLVMMPLLIVLVIAMAGLALFLIRKRIIEYRIISLLLFLLCAACWSFTDMALVCLLPIDMEVNSTISYYLMMLMPIPMLYFIHWSCRYRVLRLRRPILIVLLGNIVLQTVLFLTNLASMHQMLIFSQIYLLFMLFYGVGGTINDYRAHPTEVGKIQILAFVLPTLMGCFVVVSYWTRESGINLYRTMFQATIFVFLIVMLVVLMCSVEQQSYLSRVKDAEINAYRTISTIDQLTGLGNRRAFDEKVEEIQNYPLRYPDALLVFMDLNGLKYANDKYGHLSGDELIISAAKSICEGFETVGSSYRIGGDEFAVIMDHSMEELLESCCRMDQFVAKYNKTAIIPLSIARGYSPLIDSNGHRLSISDWKMLADKKMYEDKLARRNTAAGGSAEDYLEIISSFVSAVDAKDSYTADHSKRVAHLSDWICTLLGVSETSMDQIHIAACLHDIGKIGIPDSILCKSDRLDREEWEIMQSHTLIGEEIVKHTKAFYDVSQIIRHHHERIDGSGYPDGKSGKEIPLGARIIAIADSIDAMTSDRSYRKAKSFEFCYNEIQKNLGRMYDAAIGSIVLEHWTDVETIILTDTGKAG